MSSQHWNGATIPTAGDPLLEAWPAFADSVGTIAKAESVASARAMLDRAQTTGHAPTTSKPAYFDIGGILYRSDGAKTGGAWVLSVMNENQTLTAGAVSGLSSRTSVNSGGWVKVSELSIPVKPYARSFIAFGNCWARVRSGEADLELYPDNTAKSTSFKSRFHDSGDANGFVVGYGTIRAGEQRTVGLYVYAATALSIDLSSDSWTQLTVQLSPSTVV